MEILKYNGKLKQRSRDMRNNSTLAEVLLWNELKQNKIGYEFLRQKPIDNYIVDFFCPVIKLAIELDGSSHDNKEMEDRFRQNELESLGIKVLRFTNEQVKKDIKGVVAEIKTKATCLNTHLPPA